MYLKPTFSENFSWNPHSPESLLGSTLGKFSRVETEVFSNVQSHPINLGEISRYRSVIILGIGFNVAQVRNLALKLRYPVQCHVQFLVVCNHVTLKRFRSLFCKQLPLPSAEGEKEERCWAIEYTFGLYLGRGEELCLRSSRREEALTSGPDAWL